jgi:hypothetical protein
MEINGNQLKLLDPNIETRREREIEKYGKSFRKVGRKSLGQRYALGQKQ